jgi:GT2 family glycosyltransferase
MGIDSVLVAFNSEDVIEGAISALAPLAGRIVVVDHGDGASARKATELSALVYEDPTNPGFGSGQNRGVGLTESEFVLLCNPDALISPEAVRLGARLLVERSQVAAIQGVIVNSQTGLPERSQGVEIQPIHLLGRSVGARRLLGCDALRSIIRRSHAIGDHVTRVPTEIHEVESLAATAMLVRRAAFAEVGGFDPSFFLYGEDLDLCRRLRLAGWKLLAVPDVWAHHLGGASMPSSWERELHWWRGTLGFAARWWGPRAWALAMVASTFRCARLALRHPQTARHALRALVIEPLRERSRNRCSRPSTPAAADRHHLGTLDEHLVVNGAGLSPSPTISVVVRCHQQGRFLAEAVASARCQTRPPDEIVVVDDGSTDETAAVLEALKEQGPLVVVHHDLPRGPATSFNEGVAATTGDLILALDADDALSQTYIERTEQAILRGADLAYGGVERFGADCSFTPPRPFDVAELGVESYLHVSTMFRRSIFEQTGGFRSDLDSLGLEDWEFWAHAIEKGAQGQAAEGCWLRYRRHRQGSRNTMARAAVLRVHLKVHRLHPTVVTRRHLARWVVRSAHRNLVRGDSAQR